MAGMAGKHHSDVTKQKIAAALRRPLDEDARALRLIGQTTVWDFAERMGCTEKTARKRLGRLVEAKLANRWRGPRGSRGHVYAIAVQPGAEVKQANKLRREVNG